MERPRSGPGAGNTGCGAGPTHNSYEGADDGQEYPGTQPRRQGDPQFRREDHTADVRGPCPFYPHSRVTAVVRSLFRTTTADAQPTNAEPVDYCQCGRGPVIGVFGLRVGGSNDRLAFFPLGSVYASLPEVAADLCCLDCVTDAVADLASGKTNAELQELARQRREMAATGGER